MKLGSLPLLSGRVRLEPVDEEAEDTGQRVAREVPVARGHVAPTARARDQPGLSQEGGRAAGADTV